MLKTVCFVITALGLVVFVYCAPYLTVRAAVSAMSESKDEQVAWVPETLFCENGKPETHEVCGSASGSVCALVHVICGTGPCSPVHKTVVNACEACKNLLVESYTKGICPDSHKRVP